MLQGVAQLVKAVRCGHVELVLERERDQLCGGDEREGGTAPRPLEPLPPHRRRQGRDRLRPAQQRGTRVDGCIGPVVRTLDDPAAVGNSSRAVPPAPVRPQGGGRRPSHGGREVLAAIVLVATSGCTWNQLSRPTHPLPHTPQMKWSATHTSSGCGSGCRAGTAFGSHSLAVCT